MALSMIHWPGHVHKMLLSSVIFPKWLMWIQDNIVSVTTGWKIWSVIPRRRWINFFWGSDTEINGILQLWKMDLGTISGVGQKASCRQIWIHCQYFAHSLHNWNSVLYWKNEKKSGEECTRLQSQSKKKLNIHVQVCKTDILKSY